MTGQPVKIGPFVGGMNTYSGPSAIGDNEAVELLNMDVDLDGSLVARPGLQKLAPDVSGFVSHVLGTFRSNAGELFIIVATGVRVSAYSTSSSTWTNISVGGPFTSCVQHADKLWLTLKPSGILQGGGKWDPVGGYVAVPAMPRGYTSCIYKERMFVSASKNADDTSINRVKFSAASDPNTWSGTDFFDVAAGDGDDITKLLVFDSSIVIFKSDSTYVFAYESAPTKGQVQRVSGTIGANNSFCAVEYENNLFVMHEANVYRISNWNWEHANIKVPFDYVNAFSTADADASSISLLGDRIVARYYDTYYVLGLKTGAWAKWEFLSRTNSIANPSFEVDNSGWVIVGGQATITRDTVKHFGTGLASGRLDTVINSTNPYATTAIGAIPALPGQVWVGSTYIVGGGSAEISVIPLDSGNNAITTYQSGVMVNDAVTWKRHSVVTPPLPAGTTSVRLRVYQRTINIANTMWFDYAMLERTDRLLPYIEGTVKHTPSEFVTNPNISPLIGAQNYYGGSYVSTNNNLYFFVNSRTVSQEIFKIRLITKAYDFGPSYSFKRLFWWGADLLAVGKTTYEVSPLVYNTPIKWGQFIGVPMDNLLTWGRPFDQNVDVTDEATVNNTTNIRTFVKLLKGLRFRQVTFTIESVVDSSLLPYRIFSLTAIVDAKETVTKKVS